MTSSRGHAAPRSAPPGGGDVAAGYEFLLSPPDGRIRLDYQFIDP
jgi:hypothetical protein